MVIDQKFEWEDLEQAMHEKGFKKVREFVFRGKVTEQTYQIDKMKIDFFGQFYRDDYMIQYSMDSLRKGVPAMVIKYKEEQLNSVDKSMLIHMFLNQQEQLEKVSADLHSLDTKMQAMMEQLILANKNRFGRSSEKMEDTQQMRFIDFPQTGLTTT